MAAAESNTGNDGSWWGWIQSAKDQVVNQSTEVFEFVKKDIEEFKKEATSVVSSTTTTLKEKLNLNEETSTANQVKKSVSGFLNHVTEAFTPSPDDADEQAFIIQNQQPVFIDRYQAAVYAIQKDADTFTLNPLDEKEYEEWIKTFDLQSKQEELSQLLADSDVLHQNYQELVPSRVSHLVFWHHYFYKIDKLEKAEAKRKEISKRAKEATEDSSILWDEEQPGSNVEISEKLQEKLLEDYEKEVKDKKNKKSVKQSGDGSIEESNEEGWEKLSASDVDSKHSSKNSVSDKSEDWEKWE